MLERVGQSHRGSVSHDWQFLAYEGGAYGDVVLTLLVLVTKYVLHKEKPNQLPISSQMLLVNHWGRVRIPGFDSLYNLMEDIEH